MLHYFNAHPKSVNMTYKQHACFSLHIAWQLALGSICAVIHAINPNWFEKSTSELSDYLIIILDSRHKCKL